MDNFTCTTCRVLFKDSEIQRLHYKTDWHRYNLKRKIVELPPVTTEEFQKRVLSHREVINSQELPHYCNSCRKSFASQNALDNHLNSKKHKEKAVDEPYNAQNSNKTDGTSGLVSCNKPGKFHNSTDTCDVNSEDSDEWEEDGECDIYNTKCLFCNYISQNLINNIEHMSVQHTFFIPDVEYCINIQELLFYLGSKIDYDFMCIWCNEKGRTFHSAEAARNHMLDKGHCKMLHEGLALAEYAEFYDYSSSYPDCEENMNKDDEVPVTELDDTSYQLVLPSGAVVGHRSLMRYYKQSLDPNRAVAIPRNTRKLHKILAKYHALGWSATDQIAAAKKARDLHHMKRIQSKYQMKLGIKANKMQKHFRRQVNF